MCDEHLYTMATSLIPDTRSFVDRYIPGYVFFGDMQPLNVNEPPRWTGRVLSVIIDEGREVVGIEKS